MLNACTNMDAVKAFVGPTPTRALVSAKPRHASTVACKCPRRPRVSCRAEDESGGSDSQGKAGGESTGPRPSFIEYVGRRFSDRKGESDSKDSKETHTPGSGTEPPSAEKKSWLPVWPTRKPAAEEDQSSSRSPSASDDEQPSSQVGRDAPDKSASTTPSGPKSEQEPFINPIEGFLRSRKSSGRDVSGGTENTAADGKGSTSKDSSNSPMRPGDVWKKVVDVIVPNRSIPDSLDSKAATKESLEPSRKPVSHDAQVSGSDAHVHGSDNGGRAMNRALAREDEPNSGDFSKPGIEELYKPPPAPERSESAGGIFSRLFGKLQMPMRKKDDREERGDTIRNMDEPSPSFSDSESSSESEGMSRPGKGEAAGRTSSEDEHSNAPLAERGDGDAKDRLASRESGRKLKVLHGGRAHEKATVGISSAAPDISSVPQSDVAAIRMIFGSETFFATETLSPPGGLIFRGNLRGEPSATLEKLERRLEARLGDKYTLCLAEGEEDLRPVVVVVPTARDKRPPSPRQRFFSSAIAGLTLSTCFARAVQANWQAAEFRAFFGVGRDTILMGNRDKMFRHAFTQVLLLFPVASIAIAIAAVVAISQVAQRIMARRHKTRIGLPYFIPSYQLGSFGAIVQVASPTPTRAALFDIALAGAATLLFASVALVLIGLKLSVQSGALVVPVPVNMLSSSLVLGWLTRAVAGGGQLHVHPGLSLVGLHPLAVIGANCLTIAALNLLPIRQLDGGRIVSAIYGRKTAILASRVTIFFLLLASSRSSYLFVFLALVIFGPWSLDRPAKNELTEPNNIRAIVGYLFLLAMLSILLPYPSHVPFKLD